MWLWPIMTLYALGMFPSQATSSTEYSTKMYYANLEVEEGVSKNITDLLPTLFPMNIINSSIFVNYFNITTTCDIRGEKSYCQCNAQYDWDQSVCDLYPGCCNQIQCTANASLPTPVCLPKSRVTITGLLTLDGKFNTSLNDSTSEYYKTMAQQMKTNLSTIYSQCSGFDSLIITGFREGSIIVEFQMILNVPINSTTFVDMTKTLESQLNATLQVTTIGMVTSPSPKEPLCYNTNYSLVCSISDTTFGNCNWMLTQGNNTVSVVTGTEVTLTSPCNLTLLNTSKLWRGNYTCSFSSGPLTHQAIIDVDIALLPEQIQISSVPQYPDCTGQNSVSVSVPVACAIQISPENYNVTWNCVGCDITNYAPDTNDTSFNLQISNVKVNINCSNTFDPTVTCIYTNRKDQVKNASVTIPVIYTGTLVCIAEGRWPKAKADTTAILPCDTGIPAVGSETQKCTKNGQWSNETQSTCVNLQLYNILQNALDLRKGYGDVVTGAFNIFSSLKSSTDNSSTINTHENINASVNILSIVGNATSKVTLNDTIVPTFLSSASNLLTVSLIPSWHPKSDNASVSEYLSVQYLEAMENLIKVIELNSSSTSNSNNEPNVQLTSCSKNQTNCSSSVFNVTVSTPGQTSESVNIIGYKTLVNLLPNVSDMDFNSIVVSSTLRNSSLENEIVINFSLTNERPRNYDMQCVFWNFSSNKWSTEGCYWNRTGSNNQMICICKHLTSFSTLMSKSPIKLPLLDEITYAGLAASISSLIVCLVVEFLVWNTVVKSNVSHFRHTALVNISLCLLMGDSVFLVNSFYENPNWCGTFTVIKHFCYLSMFFWMLCLSTMLLHQLIFVFHQMRKKVYVTISISIGYVCPLIIVLLTYKIYNDGAENVYYNAESCWLNYNSPFNGSIHAFIFPVLTIVLINFFSMMVVITKLLRPQVSEGSKGDQKEMAKSILKAIVFLTPVFGITWILGFFVLVLDLTEGFWAYFVNYAFTIINSLQGVLILLTGCFGEKKVRDALLQRFISPTTIPSKNENSTKGSSVKK